MIAEFLTTLRCCLSGAIGLDDLIDVVDSYDIWNGWQDDDAEISSLRPITGRIELLATEVAEGLRDESELHEAARDIVLSHIPDALVNTREFDRQ